METHCCFGTVTGYADGGMTVREFRDFDQISAYAADAMTWAVNAGILKGDQNRLLPQSPCTRGQIVTLLHRLLEG